MTVSAASGKTASFAAIAVPQAVEAAMGRGAALVISISGGKDSQAMLGALVALRAHRGWSGPIVALHADLGRVEWQGDPNIPGFRSASEHVRKMAADAGVELHVVRRSDGQDMIDRWASRKAKLAGTGTPFWSGPGKARYCTSDMKRDPMDSWTRRYSDVVVCEGLRAEESPDRAKKKRVEVRSRINNSVRRALTWRPIFDWRVQDVYKACGTSWWECRQRQEAWAAGDTSVLADWPMAPAYVLGNSRLSCAMCVLADPTDLINGARYNPDTWAAMAALETGEPGSKFRQSMSLAEIGRAAGLAA